MDAIVSRDVREALPFVAASLPRVGRAAELRPKALAKLGGGTCNGSPRVPPPRLANSLALVSAPPSPRGGGKPRPQRPSLDQYVARPPLRSNTAPVVNEFSSLARNVIIEAASLSSSIRPRGILPMIILRNSGS